MKDKLRGVEVVHYILLEADLDRADAVAVDSHLVAVEVDMHLDVVVRNNQLEYQRQQLILERQAFHMDQLRYLEQRAKHEAHSKMVAAGQVLRQMRVAWQNEMAAPCLLPHRYDIIECLVDQVEGMEENLAGRPALLSAQELRFAERYAKAEAQLMGKTCLGRLQPSFQKIPVPVVDLECERVYAEVVEENAESAVVPDYQDKTAEVVVELEKGTVHLLPYLSVQQQVEQGSVRLL
ncbi:synthetic lethal mutants of dpb11-1 five [Ancylostoma ceylanicum]|nr:synthetic lethal mutants of dpb11-1 five [Ancylostoma ceylanicum]